MHLLIQSDENNKNCNFNKNQFSNDFWSPTFFNVSEVQEGACSFKFWDQRKIVKSWKNGNIRSFFGNKSRLNFSSGIVKVYTSKDCWLKFFSIETTFISQLALTFNESLLGKLRSLHPSKKIYKLDHSLRIWVLLFKTHKHFWVARG